MNDEVVILGCDGYLGHALTLRLLNEGYKVIGIDDFRRRSAVEEMGSFSALPIQTPTERRRLFKSIGNFEFHDLSIELEYEKLNNIISSFDNIHTIVNLAQQPSAPYSHKSIEHARNTISGNILGTINLLYTIKEAVPTAHLVQIGSMGEYDPAVGVDISEGVFEFDYNGRTSKSSIFPRRPGSIYHASKVASTYYIDCACRWWGLKATDIMQGIVYGGWTSEIEKFSSYSRLDSDEAFGTVIHRFIIQALIGHPLTIYGKGKQKRGFLTINDSIQCLMLAIENPPGDGEYNTWNQLDTVHSMNDIVSKIRKASNKVGLDIKKLYIESPRKETTDEHYYNPIVDKLESLGFKPTRNMEEEIDFLFKSLIENKNNLMKLKSTVIPKIKWGG